MELLLKYLTQNVLHMQKLVYISVSWLIRSFAQMEHGNCSGESKMADSYLRRWKQSASSEPGPPGLPALPRTLPCALSWSTQDKQVWTYYSMQFSSNIQEILS